MPNFCDPPARCDAYGVLVLVVQPGNKPSIATAPDSEHCIHVHSTAYLRICVWGRVSGCYMQIEASCIFRVLHKRAQSLTERLVEHTLCGVESEQLAAGEASADLARRAGQAQSLYATWLAYEKLVQSTSDGAFSSREVRPAHAALFQCKCECVCGWLNATQACACE